LLLLLCESTVLAFAKYRMDMFFFRFRPPAAAARAMTHRLLCLAVLLSAPLECCVRQTLANMQRVAQHIPDVSRVDLESSAVVLLSNNTVIKVTILDPGRAQIDVQKLGSEIRRQNNNSSNSDGLHWLGSLLEFEAAPRGGTIRATAPDRYADESRFSAAITALGPMAMGVNTPQARHDITIFNPLANCSFNFTAILTVHTRYNCTVHEAARIASLGFDAVQMLGIFVAMVNTQLTMVNHMRAYHTGESWALG
jgi:hypothetical protein